MENQNYEEFSDMNIIKIPFDKIIIQMKIFK